MKKGPNSCRNYGFERSKGEFIYWFDSDDLLFDFSLEKRMEKFKEDTEAVIGKANFFDSISKEIIFSNKIFSDNLIEDYFIGNITFYVSGPIWKKSFLLKNEVFFDEDIRYLDDWDYNLRILYKNPTIVFLDEVLFLYRSHSHSLSKQIHFLNIEELKSECLARNKHFNLLQKQNLITPKIKNFMLNRYKAILRDTLISKNNDSFYFYLNLLKMQLKCFKFKDAVLSTFGFVIYRVFKKGYVLIK
jgi:cellulose synthase/poly-beta-1,6-N-acetylglucosamine synthase-like glycosyltransferase